MLYKANQKFCHSELRILARVERQRNRGKCLCPRPLRDTSRTGELESRVRLRAVWLRGRERGKNPAFTLAEILITLGIIGVVAALTIPGLMTAYKVHQLRSQFLKSYSTIQQVFRRMEADDVSTDISAYSGKMGSFYDVFKQYLAGVHECGVFSNTSDALPCAGYKEYGTSQRKVYQNYTGTVNLSKGVIDDGQLALSDGTLILLENPNGGDWLWVFVDINGFGKLPNRLGYDLFTFQFINGELRTMGDRETTYNDLEKYCNPKGGNGLNGIACAYKAKTETDYFKSLVKYFK